MGFRRVSRNENGMFVDRINDTGRVTSTISYGGGGDYVDFYMYGGGFAEPEITPSRSPSLADVTKQQMAADLRDYAGSQGFIREEIESLIAHRSLIVLHKAMMYDKLNSGDVRKRKVVNKPKVIRSGKGTSKKQDVSRKRNAQMKRLKETGRIDDSVSLFEDFIDI